jgi:hypothetical protein
MNKLATTIVALVIMLSLSVGAAVPDLFVNGVLADPDVYRLAGENSDLIMTMNGGSQVWKMYAEKTNDRMINSFGFYTDLCAYGNLATAGEDVNTIFADYNSPIDIKGTHIAEGTDVGFWMLTDYDRDGTYNNNDSYLFSERTLTRGANSSLQYFMVYDVSSFGNSTFRYGDYGFTGDFDYLFFIDDNQGGGADGDYNDMMVAMSNVPEPGTLLLFGTGLIGSGVLMRRKRK